MNTVRRMGFVVASLVIGACATPEPRAPREEPLGRAAIDVLEREGCQRLLVKTFPVEDPAEHLTTGKLWVRRCAAHADEHGLAIDVDVLGWQWIGAGSWGFDVREYVYFKASVRASVRADVGVDRDSRPVLRVWSLRPPVVEVGALGRVSARADGPAAGLLGLTLGIFGQGPNVLATSALRSGVADRIRDNAIRGVTIALSEAPPPGAPEASKPIVFHEAQKLFPGGALISGSFDPNVATTLKFEVGAGKVLARAMCVDDVLPLVDSVVEGAPIAPRERTSDVHVLQGQGEIVLEPKPCPWVLVTGADADAPVTMTLDVVRGRPPRPPSARRWVAVTLRAYEIGSPATRLFGFIVTNGDARASFGRPITRARSPAVGLVARRVEASSGIPLAIEVYAWSPRPPSFWAPTPAFDQTLIGRATVAPTPGRAHEELRAVVEHEGKPIGWVQVALDSKEVP